jgi:hypothetical protein
MVSIKDMKVGSYFDLCCKILFVHDQDIDDRAVTIYVWDGTDAPPAGGLLLHLRMSHVAGKSQTLRI